MGAGHETERRETWRGRVGFILAAAGSAVGLGNLWRFPYLAYKSGHGDRGAGAFVLVYAICVVVVCLPVMAAEIMLGKMGRANPVGAFRNLKPGSSWPLAGLLGVVTGVVILSYYSVVAGWSLEYIYKATTGQIEEVAATIPVNDARKALLGSSDYTRLGKEASPEQVERKRLELASSRLFGRFLASPWKQVCYFLVFLLLTAMVVVFGVSAGIERASKVIMPLLLAILVLLSVRALTLPGGSRAIGFLFNPDLSVVDLEMVLNALGQAFFSLSIGMGALLTYGSYLGKGDRVLGPSVAIASLDTTVALLASVAIFGTVFSLGLSLHSASTGNLFTAIPVMFARLPGGRVLAVLFYLLVAFAALTSTISLLEVAVAYLKDEYHLTRAKAVATAFVAVALAGLPSALSFNTMANFRLFGKTVFDLADYFASNIALPVGGLLICIFVGFVVSHERRTAELVEIGPNARKVFGFLVRYVSPAAVLVVLIGMLLGKMHG